jgi:hypothetical protein
MSDSRYPIFLTLDADDFRRLVAGRPVVHSVAGHRVEIRQEGLGARDMIAAVIAAMGDDPPEAAEFQPKRGP